MLCDIILTNLSTVGSSKSESQVGKSKKFLAHFLSVCDVIP